MFWGIDCSSKKINIVALGSSGIIEFEREFTSAIKDLDKRFCSLGKQFDEFLLDSSSNLPEFVAIENSIYINNIKATVGITSVIALVKFCLDCLDVIFLGVDNKKWKKEILGDGRAEKEKIMSFAKARWGEWNISNQDFADAACIALWGLKRFNNDI